MKIKFFSYGTIQKPEIQIEVFGEVLKSTIDTISGYKVLNDFEIDGINYPRLAYEKNGIVFGQIFELTDEQLKLLDEYEGDDYYRTTIQTDNNITVEIYLQINYLCGHLAKRT